MLQVPSNVQSGGDATFGFMGGRLTIRLGNASTEVAAEGQWPGRARVPGRFIQALRKALPEADPLRFRVQNGRLYAEGYSMPCAWEELPTPEVDIPIPSSLRDLLALRRQYSGEALAAAGAAAAVARAEDQRDEIIRQACDVLKRFGVKQETLIGRVDERARQPRHSLTEKDRRVIAAIARAWTILAPLGFESDDIRQLIEQGVENAWNP